jgi:hypothetical protein
MNPENKSAKIVSGLFITVLVSSLLLVSIQLPLNSPDYLTAVSADENQVLIGPKRLRK